MGSITTNMVGSHEQTQNDADYTEDEERDCESNFLDGWPIIYRIRVIHHDIFISYGESMVDIRHC